MKHIYGHEIIDGKHALTIRVGDVVEYIFMHSANEVRTTSTPTESEIKALKKQIQLNNLGDIL